MAAPDPEPGGADQLWRWTIGMLDAALRARQGVYEFDGERLCILRLGIGRAARGVTLADGTRIEPGDPVGIIHFWNEHLIPFPPGGPTLTWAAAMRRCFDRSFRSLARHVGADPSRQEVAAFRADLRLSRKASLCALGFLARRYGFEVIPAERSAIDLHGLGEDMLRWGLARAFNPRALRHHGWRSPRQELWISRRRLLGHGDRAVAPRRGPR